MADDAIKTTADALTFAEHRAIREGEKVAAEPPKPAVTAAEETTSSETHESETAAETDAADKKSQDKKRDRSLDGRISELTAARRKAEQERDELRTKIAEIEKGSRPSQTTEAKPAAAETAKPATGDDPKPKLSELLAKAKPTDSYEDVQEAWADAVDDWRQRQRTRAAQAKDAETRRTALRQGWEQKLEAARGEYDDFDTVTAGDVQAGTGLVLTRAMVEFAVEHDLGAHVGYWLGKNVAEFNRIKQLSPVQQVAELGAIARDLRAERGDKPKPEKPKAPPVSRVAPPPRTVAGTSAPEAKTTADARSMTEHRRIRIQQGRA